MMRRLSLATGCLDEWRAAVKEPKKICRPDRRWRHRHALLLQNLRRRVPRLWRPELLLLRCRYCTPILAAIPSIISVCPLITVLAWAVSFFIEAFCVLSCSAFTFSRSS
jgi:hypothetical protein